jgi:MFS transporter, ACS family, pantothenate transporter
LADPQTSRYTWANEICADDNEERALVVSTMNGLQYAVAAWLPILIFPQTEGPTFRKGFPATFAFVIAAIISVCIIQVFACLEAKKKVAAAAAASDADADQPSHEGSVVGSDPEKAKITDSKVDELR